MSQQPPAQDVLVPAFTYATIPAGNLDLNCQVAAGDPLDYQRVTHAKSVATALKAFRDSGDPLVSDEMVTTPASRAVAIESAYATSNFCPIAQMLQQIDTQLGKIDNHLRNIDNSLGNIEKSYGNIDNRLGIVETSLVNFNNHLRNLSGLAGS